MKRLHMKAHFNSFGEVDSLRELIWFEKCFLFSGFSALLSDISSVFLLLPAFILQTQHIVNTPYKEETMGEINGGQQDSKIRVLRQSCSGAATNSLAFNRAPNSLSSLF